MQGILFNFSFHVFTIEWKVVVAIPSNEFSEPTLLTNVIELYDMLIVIPVIKLQSPEMYLRGRVCMVKYSDCTYRVVKNRNENDFRVLNTHLHKYLERLKAV